MTTHHYILRDHTPIPEPNLLAWAKWMDMAQESNSRRVAETKVGVHG